MGAGWSPRARLCQAALNANKFDDVQRQLQHDAGLAPDLCDLVMSHLQRARARWETRKAWSVTVPLPVWDEYAREAKLTGRSITDASPRRSVGTTSAGGAPSTSWDEVPATTRAESV